MCLLSLRRETNISELRYPAYPAQNLSSQTRGFKGHKKPEVSEIPKRIKALRDKFTQEENDKKQQKKDTAQELIKGQPGKVPKGKQKPKKEHLEEEVENRNAGSDPEQLPEQMQNINFTLAEEKLRCAALGPDHQWAEKTPQEAGGPTKVELDSDCECEEQLYQDTEKALSHVNSYDGWGRIKGQFGPFSRLP